MPNKYYEAGGQRAAKVGDLFAVIAPRYDLINDLQSLGLHRWWKRRLVKLAGARPGLRALDLCCGTGDVAFALAGQGAEATGLDFGKPDNAVWRMLYFAYLRTFVPVFGRVFCGDGQTHAYILESLRHYPAQHGVAAKMQEMGGREVRIIPLLGGVMTINFGMKP